MAIKKRQTDNKIFTVRFSIDVLERARKKSAETGINISFVLQKALEEWVKPEADISKSLGAPGMVR